jgi:hypothetical protein
MSVLPTRAPLHGKGGPWRVRGYQNPPQGSPWQQTRCGPAIDLGGVRPFAGLRRARCRARGWDWDGTDGEGDGPEGRGGPEGRSPGQGQGPDDDGKVDPAAAAAGP